MNLLIAKKRQAKKIETRSMPTLVEQRNALLEEMETLVKTAQTETRAFTDAENNRFEEIKKEVAGIDKTMNAIEESRSFEQTKKVDEPVKEERALQEERAFENYIRGVVEDRADKNLTVGENGAIIPKTIAQKIITKVKDICPIYSMSTKYNVGGTLAIPFYDESSSSIKMAYANEFTELESTSAKFGNIELTGFLAGALSKVSKSLINNTDFDLTSFVVNAMAEAISEWIENELLNGTTGKVAGLSTVTQEVVAASAVAITTDELIDVQEEVRDQFQGGAIWIMNRETRKAIRKLKDNDGNYILNRDASAKWGYTLLGKDVYTSDNMPKMEAEKTAIYYGDMSGLAVKLAEKVSIEILREKYATQHAIGVVGWIEIDAKIENTQKIAKLKMATA